VTLHFGGESILAHKVILAGHSKWFSNAFEGRFQEASADFICLHDDDPCAMMKMLQYIYQLPIYEKSNDTATAKELLEIVEVCVVADKYVVSGLLETASKHFEAMAATSWVDLWTSDSLYKVIKRIYDTSPSPDSQLRQIAVSRTCAHINCLKQTPNKSVVRALFEQLPEFSTDVILRLSEQNEVLEKPFQTVLNNPEAATGTRTPLHAAAQSGDAVELRRLIASGMNIESRDPNGETALHFAAWHGKMACVSILVEAGADVNATSRAFLATPLQWSEMKNHAAISRYLINQGGVIFNRPENV